MNADSRTYDQIRAAGGNPVNNWRIYYDNRLWGWARTKSAAELKIKKVCGGHKTRAERSAAERKFTIHYLGNSRNVVWP